MMKEPSGDPGFPNHLAAFYVRQNTPGMIEHGLKVENDMAYLLGRIARRIDELTDGSQQPTIPGQADLFEIQSPFTGCIYRTTLHYVQNTWVIDTTGLEGRYMHFFQKLSKINRARENLSYENLVKSAFESQSEYSRFFSRLAEIHPMIGIMNMFFLDYAKKHKRECLSWYEPAIKHAQAILLTIQSIEDIVQERTRNPLTKEFISDVRKELELLLVDCMNTAFVHAHNQDTVVVNTMHSLNDLSSSAEKGHKHDGVITAHFQFEVKNEDQKRRHLVKMKSFYQKFQDHFKWMRVSGIGDAFAATEKLAEKGVIAMPFYFKGSDIAKFLRFFETYFKAVRHALEGKSQQMPSEGKYDIRFRNGMDMLFRGMENTKIDKDIKGAQARISFKYEGVKIRFDRDEVRKKVLLDFGEADFDETLAMVDMLLAGSLHDSNDSPSLMDTRLQRLVQYRDPARKAEVKEIHMRAKIALIASAVMSITMASFPHRKEYFASYHSSDHISKPEYFENFQAIAEDLERIFSGKKE